MNQSIAFDINKDIINKDKKNNQRFISYQNIGLQLTWWIVFEGCIP